MNWKEEVEKQTQDMNPMHRLALMAWIQTQIIEKIIEDIPDDRIYKTPDEFFGRTATIKQQLRDKWLGKEQE